MNAVTTPRLTPSYDNKIFQKYSKKTIQNKKENKLAYQEELGLIVDKKIPVACITIDLTDEKGGILLHELLDGILELNIQLLIVAVGTEKYQNLIAQFESTHSKKIRVIPDSEDNRRKVYAASDIALVFSKDKEDTEEISYYLGYGVVPVIHKSFSKHLTIQNYDPVNEDGNAFVYENENKWHFFYALSRAIENFTFPFDWQTIQKYAMETVSD